MISKIFHVSDVHIRLYKRHKEYEQVFKRLFKYIDGAKDENSVIVLAGDIVHNKTDMTPELIDVTSNFLRRCADLLPTILICGNHDANLNNSNRLDALTPIVNSLNHSNLFYWRDSGIYEFKGVTFSVFGILDSKENWITAKNIQSKNKIALHHGPVIGSLTDLITIESGINSNIFNGFDLVLLGDIHQQQFLNEERTIGYSSSLIQQSHGESIENHGILVWDVKRRKGNFVQIPNDFGYYTFYVIDGKCDIPDGLPKNLRIRVKYQDTNSEQLEEIISQITKKYTILELVKQKSSLTTSTNKNNLLGNSRDLEYQKQMISEYLKSLSEITDDELSEVIQLNVETNRLLPIQKLTRNVTWSPIKLEFSNMFSYGEENLIEFDNFKGIYGIFSSNASGKSSILDILSFVIYDKSTRASKASQILNNTKEKFYCKFQFSLNGTEYFIERIGSKTTSGAVRVDVNFWYYDELGEKVSLNGEDRDKTNYAIRDLLGTYDDFVMTALSTQYDNQNFVEKSQRDRKELLYKFLDIFIYDDLYKLAKENSREYQVLIREFEKDNLHEKSSQLYQSISKLQKTLESIDSDLTNTRFELKERNNKLVQLNKDFLPIEENLDIDDIESSLLKNNQNLTNIISEVTSIRNELHNLNTLKSEIEDKIKDFEEIDDPTIEFQKLEESIRKCNSYLKQILQDLQICKKKETQLHNHKYDPGCKFCIDNDFVRDARSSIAMIPKLIQEKELLDKEISTLNDQLNILSNDITVFNEYNRMKKDLTDLISKELLLAEKENSLKYQGKSIQDKIFELTNKKAEYHKNSEIIIKNNEILLQIETIRQSILELEKLENNLNTQHRQMYPELERKKKDYDLCIESLKKYSDFVKKYRIHELYLQALSRDGVPYKIVETILPVLENEVNIILNSVVNFTIRLEATDEKYVHAYLVYDGSNSWPIELSSGMERFILSLAFRTALSEITSLPKSNFLAIDEGFGVLDSDNIMQMGKLFQYLKSQYDYLICISHIDSMKDLVDRQIKIDKDNGLSKLVYYDSQ